MAGALRELEASNETWGIWTHRTKDGVERRVDIRSRNIRHLGDDAVWVVARDVSRLIALEEERNALLAREKMARHEAEAAARYYQSLFETLPGRFVVLDAEDYRIVSVSDAYLQTTTTQRDDIFGRRLFDMSPNASGEADSAAPSKLRASFDRVRETGRTDIMDIERHPIRLPASQGGGFVERYWSAVNTPVRGPDGEIRFIIHRVEDVTDYVRSRSGAVQSLSDETELLELDVLLRARGLQSANERLKLKEKALQDALRIGGMGRWELDLDTDTVIWSDEVHAIVGVSRDAFDGRLASFLDRVHPDDIDALRLAKDRAVADGLPLEHLHRICRPNGEIRYVREIGERVAPGRLAGIIQDITEIELSRRRAVETAGLLRMAGHTARFGGWRIDLASPRVTWSDEAAAIHDLPPGTSPSIDEALKYIAPEARQRVSAAFEACCLAGDSFDATVQLITARNRRVWVRVVGEAERDACGNIVAVHGGVQDIDEIVREREGAKKLAERPHATLDNISDAFFLLDHDWRFSYLNKEATRALKHGEAELLGREIWAVFPEARDATFGQQYRKAVSERVTVFFTEYYPPLAKWFEVKAYPSSDGLAVYLRDVTSRRAEQEQLRLLETAVSRLNDIVIITDTEPLHDAAMRIVYVNDAFVRLTGFSREEAIGNTPRILHGPGTQAEELARIRHALLNKEPVRAELLNYTRDGEELWLEIDMIPIQDAGGRHTHWVAVERDITERNTANGGRDRR